MDDMTKKGSSTGGPSRRSPRLGAFEQEFPGGSESANASAIALVRTYDALIAKTNKATSLHGLSSAGRQALAVIEGAGGTLSPTLIAQRVFTTTASMTSLLDTLERRGLVARLPDPDDRRKILVTLTDAGQQTVDEFLPKVVALQTAALARLSESEREQLLSSLAVIRETLAELDAAEIAAAAPPRVTPQKA
jgi:DNA-binding MarR family transcriptional regulator